MAPQAIREALAHRPFEPFHVRLPDGERILIQTSDHAALTPSGRRFFIFTDDERTRILDPILISELETASSAVKLE